MEMLSINLNRMSEIPLYEQLYQYIKFEIAEGRIRHGEKLPSKRKLSDFLKVSQNTVETAYDQLIAEGYVEGIPRKGFYVLAFEDLEYVPQEIQKHQYSPIKETEIIYNLHPGWIDTKNFPFAKWRKLAKMFMDEQNHHLLLLGSQQGEYELREQIVQYLYQARGVRCHPDQIIVGAGIEILLQQLMQLMKKDTVYGVEDPGYHVISKLLKNYPEKLSPLQADEEGIITNEIDSLPIDAIYVTPSHHFPYGSALSVNRRIRLLKWADQKEERYIIEDDYDSEFRYTGKSIPALKSMDYNDKVIYLGTFSKSLNPSIRISFMVLPENLMKEYKQELSFYHCSVSRIDQHILARFMQEGEFERHLNRMKKIYRRKLEKTLEILKPYENIISVIGSNSGFHLVLSVNNGMDESTLVNRALKNKIKVYPLSAYTIEKRSIQDSQIIIGFGGMPENQIDKAIGLLLKSWGVK